MRPDTIEDLVQAMAKAMPSETALQCELWIRQDIATGVLKEYGLPPELTSRLAALVARERAMGKTLSVQLSVGVNRPETGTMQFGQDWPGIFIRGDNAFFHALALKQVLEAVDVEASGMAFIYKADCVELVKLLESCNVNHDPPPTPQKLVRFEDCLIGHCTHEGDSEDETPTTDPVLADLDQRELVSLRAKNRQLREQLAASETKAAKMERVLNAIKAQLDGINLTDSD